MLGWLKTNVSMARDKLTTEVSKFKNKDFMEATATACAMIAAADGDISSAEKMKMTGFINNSPELKAFNLNDVINVFNDACGKFEFDYQIGQAEALKTINKIKKDDGAARLLVRVACAIGASDGSFDDQEKAACRLICSELGLNPADFEL
ncbi:MULTISPECIES: tellurite resistance TerB family protein [unclassified Oceanobacter]|nr:MULTISPECIES: tellurite resistance TerB family protein [unclassified Oceanobacter]MDO6680744.1 tellurite resistance TerB family protein [Oceanobacter sp. 5_MG-2023]MDP2504512.1 tellurite resistance TerB family protein [Oceanobacter sp. 3_MG-2023]MDP2547034.1 tellurite resistance TerB family protein [Oceanobacter sp. 4_MG-2023]MDP2607858.1 tellurite resistance TerB family protein [Oceanobacter sp. 1_MG-2023]MDP2610958.1 tellurite resistance TerB family protein [Oceanobacter sp. 2_MG-2023]